MSEFEPSNRRRLTNTVVCPHCWTIFPPEETLWIAESPTLLGDRKLGDSERLRFLPTEFNEKGFAIDPAGYACKDHACPHCHLRLPASLLETAPLFMSIVGAPAVGKSYYLSASTWTLRKLLPDKFLINYTDADAEMNRRLQEYEEEQFLSGDRITQIEKTQEEGDLYNAVNIHGETIVFPQPFVFSAIPTLSHPNADRANSVARTICLYDNAGESYLPTHGADSASLPVTRHLAQSKCVFFLFDPTQDADFRAICRAKSNDPQLQDNSTSEYAATGRRNPDGSIDLQCLDFRRSPLRQEAILNETIKRIRTYLRMKMTQRYENPFIVIVAKYDVWKDAIDYELPKLYTRREYKGKEYKFLRLDRIHEASDVTRNFLKKITPEFVAMVESFAKDSLFIPVSATGSSPEYDKSTGIVGFRSSKIDPIWCEAPMLYATARLVKGLIPVYEDD